MELVTYITQAEEKANGRTKLAQFLEVRPNYLTDAKAGRCGLPAYACVKLAQLLGEDPTRVIAASELVTEKKDERRAVWLPFVQGTANAAKTAAANEPHLIEGPHHVPLCRPTMNPDPDSSRRFGGIGRLYGDAGASRIAAAHVCIVGIGGVGSWAAEALARSGVGRLTLIDLDHVGESNINRQVHALDATLGEAKVSAMAKRIAAINPHCRIDTIEDFVSPENVATLLPACTAVIDAIDQVRAKAALIAHCRRAATPVVTTGGAGGRRDPTRIEVADLSRTTQDPLASKVRARLRREYGFPREPKTKFGVDCVFSQEPIVRPAGAGCAVGDPGPQGLNCAGYGSAMTVTAAFGLAAAARVLARLAAV